MKVKDLKVVNAIIEKDGKPVFAFGVYVAKLNAGEYDLRRVTVEHVDAGYDYDEWELYKDDSPVLTEWGTTVSYSIGQINMLEVTDVTFTSNKGFVVSVNRMELSLLRENKPNGVGLYEDTFQFPC